MRDCVCTYHIASSRLFYLLLTRIDGTLDRRRELSDGRVGCCHGAVIGGGGGVGKSAQGEKDGMEEGGRGRGGGCNTSKQSRESHDVICQELTPFTLSSTSPLPSAVPARRRPPDHLPVGARACPADTAGLPAEAGMGGGENIEEKGRKRCMLIQSNVLVVPLCAALITDLTLPSSLPPSLPPSSPEGTNLHLPLRCSPQTTSIG